MPFSILDILGMAAFIILIILLPAIVRMRIFSAIESAIAELEDMEGDAMKIVAEVADVEDIRTLEDYLEFFIIPPSDIDPSGLADKYRKLLEMGDMRLRELVDRFPTAADTERRANIIMCIRVAAGMRGILKFLRHNLEIARKTGNLQILVALQMNLALIMRTARAYMDGCRAISRFLPIGDGAGPLTAGMLIEKGDQREYLHEMVYVKKRFMGKDVGILRPRGPGSRLGMMIKAMEEIFSRDDFDEIIMVDAAAKLEGEKTGAVACGMGVAIGGSGVEKWFIENMALERRTHSIIIKMSPEEAMGQMTEEVLGGCRVALEQIKGIISESDADSILLVGAGNSSGIPDSVEKPGEVRVKKEDNGRD
ncbi:DUF1512 domain-containing protein [Methanothermobacter thermautotrophicus]|uniref:DUF1512 domain-containing protein n=1 Tax=Methanothermobacter thermautotrophicus TaxID=145262 RepID=UPI003D7F8919